VACYPTFGGPSLGVSLSVGIPALAGLNGIAL